MEYLLLSLTSSTSAFLLLRGIFRESSTFWRETSRVLVTMPYFMRKWAQNIVHGSAYGICQVGKNAEEIWGGTETPKRKLKIVKLPEFL